METEDEEMYQSTSPQTIVNAVECSLLSAGDVIVTDQPMNTARIIDVSTSAGITRVTYTDGVAGRNSVEYPSHRKLLRVERSSLN